MNKACRFNFEIEFPSYKDVLACENLELNVNAGGILKRIAHNINIDVKRGEKVAVIGANGIGKSTLLKTLVGENTSYGGNFEFGRNVSLSFYDQEHKLLHPKSSVLNEIWDRFPRMDESEVRTLLGTVLFTDEDVYKEVSMLSGGEKARLMLLVLMLERANTMLLDEPTNHLDLSSREALDGAVKEFEGTVILVSHDRYFLNKCADKILEMTSDGITCYSGNYDDYLEYKGRTVEKESDAPLSKNMSAAQEYELNKRRQANIKNLTKKLASAEEKIEHTEAEIEEIKQQISDAGSDYDKVSELFEKSQNLEKELNNLYELWNTLSIELESCQ